VRGDAAGVGRGLGRPLERAARVGDDLDARLDGGARARDARDGSHHGQGVDAGGHEGHHQRGDPARSTAEESPPERGREEHQGEAERDRDECRGRDEGVAL
jgi:hypothetical protein